MNPTNEQIKEFWECIGWDTLKDYGIRKWVDNKGNISFVENLPPIDLNNLFKYAVPKVYSWTMGSSFPNHQETLALVNYNNKCGESVNLDPSIALFWAIWGVIKG